MTRDVAVIDRRAPLDDALRMLQERSAPAIAVVEPDGRLVGLISTETVGELMLVSQAMPQGFRLGTKAGPSRADPGASRRGHDRLTIPILADKKPCEA